MHLRKTKVAIGAVGVVGLLTFGATLASADGGDGNHDAPPGEHDGDGGHGGHDGDGGEETLPAPSLSPSEGPPGTEIAVSGTDCFEAHVVQVKLKLGGSKLDFDEPAVNEDGTWTGYLVVPDDDSLIGQQLTVNARCNPVYDPAVFNVTPRPPGPTQPTVTQPTTPPTPPPPPAPQPTAPAPTPVGAQQPAQPSAPQPTPAPAATPVTGQPELAG